MLAVTLGFLGAIIFGASDFIGGLASKRMSSLAVTFLAALGGLVVAIIGALLIPSVWSLEAIFWGAVAGIFGSTAIILLYASLAIGPMSILSPLGAFVSAVFPIAWALIAGESLGAFGFIGLAVGLVAVVLVGFVPEKTAVRPSFKGLALAIAAGILIGAFLICIDQAPADAGLTPLISNRIVSATVSGTAIAIAFWVHSRRSSRSAGQTSLATHDDASPRRLFDWRSGLRLALFCGLIDGTGNALLLLGIQIGDLSVMSVLTAMYPAGTIVLAAIVLKERVAPVQAVGLVLAIVAAAFLALA